MITDGHRKEKDTVLKKKHSRKKVTPQNGQTHSINSSAVADKFFLSVFDSFVGLTLKGFASHICTIYSWF